MRLQPQDLWDLDNQEISLKLLLQTEVTPRKYPQNNSKPGGLALVPAQIHIRVQIKKALSWVEPVECKIFKFADHLKKFGPHWYLGGPVS